MTTPSIILGRVVRLNAALFQIMMVSNIFLKMWVIYYHRLIMPNTAAGWHLLQEVGWREPGGIALSPEQFLGRNLAACPAFLSELWEAFPFLQCAGWTCFPLLQAGLMITHRFPWLGITKALLSPHVLLVGEAQLLCFNGRRIPA